MTSIVPIRGAPQTPRAKKTAAQLVDELEAALDAEKNTLPVPASPPKTQPTGGARLAGDAAIQAQVIGERRGLRAGPTIHDDAKTSYVKTAWSGSRDRRRPKGGAAKTKI